ncbi:MAG: Glycolate dehydrogenase (EC, FAD-binding subunit GlcE [uncultured Thiotrichaceae bacterium]|uniref:Glycolate dehydrogenase (EC, FAD-binding subunit GlcE) n=1 Tax=uncultured Thiotrichaceae bacterium TaxID=298394 RepID=A0A6S6U4B9_9GAMM|nr:MAG: Glycolate dehydrogenase (EC, FAD-binding subunit GlcE [uncultured Thiotrichaceae bacterium]
MSNNTTQQFLEEQVQDALENEQALNIQGFGSKRFYGNTSIDGKTLDTSIHSGIVTYVPSELCITVKAGTPLKELEAALEKNNQILPFEPPHFGENSSIGGIIATGMSGPRRAYSGSVRDAILGVKIINGFGKTVSFGGQVMKNVAGYDVSRLLVGSLGTLGVILELSIRVIPKPEVEKTVILPSNQSDAIKYFNSIRKAGLPISATCHVDEEVHIRLAGSNTHINHLIEKKHWHCMDGADAFWESIRNQTHTFFSDSDKPLWRMSVAAASSPSVQLDNHQLVEWGGALRWIKSKSPPNVIQGVAKKRDGEAILFNGEMAGVDAFPSPEKIMFELHERLKRKLDPKGIFNPDRMYKGL